MTARAGSADLLGSLGGVLGQRAAVTALFLTNGALWPSVLPRLPEIKRALQLTDGQLGLALLGVGLGGLVASTGARWLLPRLRSRRLAVGAAVALAVLVPLVGAAPTRPVLFLVLLGVGVADALTDVAMNVAGIAVQRAAGRPVLSSMHAVWSLGAVGAGFAGTTAAALGVPLVLHLSAVAGVLALLALGVTRRVPDDDGSGELGRPGRLSRPLVLLCGLAVLAALLEDAPSSWSAIYLREATSAPVGVAGLGFAAFMTAMVTGRLAGDRLVARFGVVAVVRLGGTLAAAALTAGLVAGTTPAGVLAFGGVGLGVAALFPAMFSAAGALPGQGVAAMNTAARLGFLASPPVVGGVADAVGLRTALGLVVVPAAVGVAMLAGAARTPAEPGPLARVQVHPG